MVRITKDTPISEILKLAAPCNCDKCKNGCRYGSGILIAEDLRDIAKFIGVTEDEAREKYLEEVEQFNKKFLRPKINRKEGKKYGNCIFFDEIKGCKIHPVKPLQCRTSIHCKEYGEDLSKWFMVNYIIDENDPESIRQYSIYLRTNEPLLGGELNSLVSSHEKLRKMLNFEVLK